MKMLDQNDVMFSQPMPLDHAARMAATNQRQMLEEGGLDILEEIMSLPQGYSIIEEQHDVWQRNSPGHEAWAEMGKLCTDFYENKQWTDAEKKQLEREGRPVNTKNKIAPLMRILFGFHRQNRYDIKFLPGNDGTGTDDIAATLGAISKQIDENNNSEWLDSQVFQDGILSGRGFWDVRLDFSRNRLGEVKEVILDPFSVYVDGEAECYDPNGVGGQSPWKNVTYNRWMSAVEIFTLYGKMPLAELSGNMPSQPIANDFWFGLRDANISPEKWFGMESHLFDAFEHSLRKSGSLYDHINRQRKLIRVLDRQHKVLKKVNMFLDLETGQEKIIPDGTPVEKIQRIMQWVEARGEPVTVVSDYKEVIRWTITAGDRILFDEWSPYDNYTYVPFFPYFRRGKTKSPIEDLLDPQREINKRSSAFLHIIMSTANSGWMMEKGALDDEMKQMVEDEGSRPGIMIEYEEGYNAPQRIDPAATPMNMKKLEDDATRDLKEIAGINDSALGQLDKVQSGKAIEARQRQSIIGAENYFDNFSFSRELKGRARLNLIQNFYTEPRLIRVRSGAGKDMQHMINLRSAAGEIENNVTVGKYDLAIDASPISASFQDGVFEDAMRMVEKGIPIPPDILIEISNLPNKEEIKKRLNEPRLIELANAQIQSLITKAQLGLPPDAPLPPILSPGDGVVVDASAQSGATAGQPMQGQPPMDPAQGSPGGMPPAAGAVHPAPPPGAPQPLQQQMPIAGRR